MPRKSRWVMRKGGLRADLLLESVRCDGGKSQWMEAFQQPEDQDKREGLPENGMLENEI